MRTFKLLFALFTLFVFTGTHAQTADEIIDNYLENVGGKDSWSNVENMRVTGVGRQQGVDYPFVATYMKDGRYVIDVDLQGTSFIVEAFDGENSWATNFQTQKAEASDSESSNNVKLEAHDQIAGPFHNYKEKGYTIEFLGKDTYEGSEVYKLKVTKKPESVDGKEEDNIDIFYFDMDNFVPIAFEDIITSGPAKGATGITEFSDYQDVDGLIMAFSQISKFNGQVALEMLVKTVEFNVEVDEAIFNMPKE